MKIVIPYNNDISEPEIHYCVKLNMQLQGLEAEWVKCKEPNDYAVLINRLWKEGEVFIIIEHDVFVTRRAVERIWECPEIFCGYNGMLTCAKIIPKDVCPVDTRTSWIFLDKELQDGLYKRGITYHDHSIEDQIINLNKENIPK